MRYSLPYSKFSEIDFGTFDVSIYKTKKIPPGTQSEASIIRDSLLNPIGKKRLSQIISPSMKVLILIDDISRPTPIARIIPYVLEEILLTGIPKTNIKFLIALGTHRPMTAGEIEAKLGRDIANTYEVINHEWDNPTALFDYGTTNNGTKVILNRLLHESDFVLGVGSITPHPAAGFTGGGKIVTPGVATDDAAGNFHWESVQVSQMDVLGIRDNPMRQMIDENAKLAGLQHIVNVVMDGSKNIVACVSGDFIEAHREGCRKSLEIWAVGVEEPKSIDIFITYTYPMDQDLWQAAKALCALDCIVPDNCVVILISGAEEGIAPMHPEVLEFGYQNLDTMAPLVSSGAVSKIVGHYLVQGGRVLKRTHSFLVTPTVSAEDARKLGFVDGFNHPQHALAAALALKGEYPKIMVLESGGETCPSSK